MVAFLLALINKIFPPTAAKNAPATPVNLIQESNVSNETGTMDGKLVSYDENLLEKSRTQWQFGDWASLIQIDRDTLQHHPDRARLCLLVASAHLQQGDIHTAKNFLRLAEDWGCQKKLIAKILISGVHNSLGRATATLEQQSIALHHFENAIAIGTPGSELRLNTQARASTQYTQLHLHGNPLSLHFVHHVPSSKKDSAQKDSAAIPKQRKDIRNGCIVIAGMRHSGSTAAFNIIRIALSKKNLNFVGYYSEGKSATSLSQPSENQFRLVKTHEFRDDIAYGDAIIITTQRDLRDTIASATRRKFPLLAKMGNAIEYAKYNRTLHDIWLQHSDHVFVYESFMSEPILTIAKMLDALGLNDVNEEEIYKEVLSLPVDKYETTLLSPTHITDPEHKLSFNDTLELDEIHKINAEHGVWLKRYGYMKGAEF